MSLTLDVPDSLEPAFEHCNLHIPEPEAKAEPEPTVEADAKPPEHTAEPPEPTAGNGKRDLPSNRPPKKQIRAGVVYVETERAAEQSLLDEIYKAEKERREAIAAQREAEQALADANQWLGDATQGLNDLVKDLPARLLELRGEKREEDEESEDTEKKTPGKDVPYPRQPEGPFIPPRKPEQPSNWRDVPTSSLIEGIPRLGEKKAEALVDELPTLGKLEGARVEASKENKHFATKLPKGIGNSIADELENRMLKAITDHATEPTEPSSGWDKLTTVGRTATSEASEPEPISQPGSNEGPTAPNENLQVDDVDRTETAVSDDTQTVSGAAADYEDVDPPEAAGDDESDSDDEQDTEAYIASINERVEQLNTGNEDDFARQLENSEPWEQGYDAGLDDLPASSCTYRESEERDDWIRGWLMAMHQDSSEL